MGLLHDVGHPRGELVPLPSPECLQPAHQMVRVESHAGILDHGLVLASGVHGAEACNIFWILKESEPRPEGRQSFDLRHVVALDQQARRSRLLDLGNRDPEAAGRLLFFQCSACSGS